MDEGLSLPLTKRLTPRHWLYIDVAVAVFLSSSSIVGTAVGPPNGQVGPGWNWVRYLAILVACLPLPLRRSRPLQALFIITPATVVLVIMGVRGPTLATAAFVVYSVAATTNRRTSLRAAGVVILAVVAGGLLAASRLTHGEIISLPIIVVVGWLAGENTRARRNYAEGLVERAAERERERAQRALRAAADERVRIARELHDVVAHAMSVVAVRSGVARMVIDTNPDEVRQALGIIETTSRQALNEMRLLVGVLRQSEQGGPDYQPAPGLADLPELLNRIGQAGVDVDLAVEGASRSLPPGVDLSAYRIVQEALTNVVRHAGPATAHLVLRYRRDLVEIEVVDDGGHQAPSPGLAADGRRQGQGHGLVGMRERVGLFGGDLVAAPAGNGFRVLARLRCDQEQPAP